MIPIYISQISFVNSGAAVVYFFLNYSVQSEKPQTAAIAEKELPFTL